jgi:hypothetical protein
LNIAELAHLQRLLDRETQHLAPECAAVRKRVIAERAPKLHERTGTAPEAARRIAERQYGGILLPSVILPFDDPELEGASVADVLADPERYEGETLADPIEGVGYGVAKAKVLLRPDGTVLIHSFAHGRTVYVLKHDAASVRALLEGTPPDARLDRFVQLALIADLDIAERTGLRDYVHESTRIGKRVIDQTLKAAEQARAEQEREWRIAKRTDPRPRIEVPLPDAPWGDVLETIEDVLSSCADPEPPMRDRHGYLVEVRTYKPLRLHTLTEASTNAEEDDTSSRLPSPEQPLLVRLNEPQTGELIERHIDYVNGERSVHLGENFVHHYQQPRPNGKLPIAHTVMTLPLVLRDGSLLAVRGLHRPSGIVFRIPDALWAFLPNPEDCTPAAISEAQHLLVNEWLGDVACDYLGRCTILAAALTIMQRPLLSSRPVFFVSAGRRGNGKTTLLVMLTMAIPGMRPAAAAWSNNPEERRKALMAYPPISTRKAAGNRHCVRQAPLIPPNLPSDQRPATAVLKSGGRCGIGVCRSIVGAQYNSSVQTAQRLR